ncbi:MAG: gamma-glutamyl-gamma-aminobutyrate hydrolase family protein [Pseudomonadota bacterium]
MRRPVIGVTVSRRSGWRIFPLMALSIRLAGGTALRWDREDRVDIAAVDGVVIGGGDDIGPMLYGGKVMAEARLDPQRDRLERRIVERCLRDNTPLLGVCRGAQMLNVVQGGTLNQDAYAAYPSRHYKTVLPRKRIDVVAGTRLERIVGPEEMRVNALHSQSVARLGEALRVAARDDGGMPQAVERTRDPFALGVQWHPEHLFYARRQRALFSALTTAAAAYHEARGQVQAVDRDAA